MPNMTKDHRIDRSFFIRVAVHSLRKLKTIRNASGFSKNRLRRISEKISDLKDPAIRGSALTELEYELSRDIISIKGSHDVIEGRYISYFNNIVSWYRSQQKQPPEVEKEMLEKVYGDGFEFLERMEPYGNYRLWHVTNRESGLDSMLYIYRSDDLNGKDPDALFRKWKELDHPSILRLRGLHVKEGSFALETEYFDSDFLWSSIRSLDRKKAFVILRKVADALEYANSMIVYHTALSPGAVMVSGDGGVKVSGWNSPFLIRFEPVSEKKRLMRFIAPEVSESSGSGNGISEKADVFTLSRLATFMLTKGTSVYIDSEKVRIPYQLANALTNGVERDPLIRGTIPGIVEELDNAIEDFGDMGSGESGIQPSGGNSAGMAASDEAVSAPEVEVEERPAPVAAPSSKMTMDDDTRSRISDIASQLEKMLEQERYSSVLTLIESNEDFIVSAFPALSERISEIKPNLRVAIRIPGAPRKELNERISEILSSFRS